MQSDNIDNVTIMSMNQMCDLALGFVHPGVIHFDLLHQLLRAIIQQCNLIDVKIKIQGDKSVEMQKFTSSPLKTSQVTLPSMNGPKGHPSSTSIPPFSVRDSGPMETPFGPASTSPKCSVDIPSSPSKTKDKLSQNSGTHLKAPSVKDTNVIILDQTTNKPLEHTVSITVEQMQWIVDSIDGLQNQINEMKTLPNNHDIIEALRETGALMGSSSNTKSPQKAESGTASQRPMSRSLSDTPLVDMLQMLSLTKRVDAAEESITKLASLIEDIARDYTVDSNAELLEIESLSELQGLSIATLGNKNALELLTKELKSLKLLIYGDGEDLGSVGANIHAKVSAVEVRLQQVMDQVEILNRLTSEQISNLLGQYGGLVDTVALLESRLVDSNISHETPIKELTEKYALIEEQIEQVQSDQKKVLDENIRREMEISALIEQMEVLKTTKVTQEDFDSALEKKLDAELLTCKVSQEKFDQTYDELKINLEDAITRLTTQEEMWQKALTELQNELVSKLEKNELIALQDFVKSKVQLLRNKLNSMKIYQKEQEAAATKQMLMKNVKCLSCDADVSIRVTQTPQDYPRSPSLPPSRTMAPYLAYELDVMRKQQRGLAHSKNLHHFEASVRNKKDRVENRYCGGPHTVTTPVQRVTRMGNFLEQWGPEITTADEKFIKGTDQKIYVGSTAETTSSNRKKSAMTVEGDILRYKKSILEELAHIPEKDSLDSKGDTEREIRNNSLTSDSRRRSSVSSRTKTSSKKSLNDPETTLRTKVSALRFDDNPQSII